MASDQLLPAVVGDLLEAPGPALLEQKREEVDLEEDVAKLVQQLAVVAAVGSVRQLVGLFDRMGDDRALVLFSVPGTLLAQLTSDLVQLRQRLSRRVRLRGRAAPLVGRGGPWVPRAGGHPVVVVDEPLGAL
jgi:hypothetical protein